MDTKNLLENYYTWFLVLGVLGGILFLFTEFAGYTTPPYYYWYSISLESTFYNPDHAPLAPLFLLVAGLFFFNAFIGLKGLDILKIELPFDLTKFGFYSALGILAVTVIGAIAFELILAESGASNWWLGTGFYAGLVGGIVMGFLHYRMMKAPVQEA